MRLTVSCQAQNVYYYIEFRQLGVKCQEPTNSYDVNMGTPVKT